MVDVMAKPDTSIEYQVTEGNTYLYRIYCADIIALPRNQYIAPLIVLYDPGNACEFDLLANGRPFQRARYSFHENLDLGDGSIVMKCIVIRDLPLEEFSNRIPDFAIRRNK
jgi:hypothetical protein